MSKLIPDCLGPMSRPSLLRWKVPAGAWDMHFHALGPQSRFPYASSRKYTPPDAPLEACLQLHDRLGVDRGLVVHANTHGFDNAVDLDAVARSNGRYLAVVRLDASTTRHACVDLNASGVRGVRFAFNPQHGGTLDKATVDHVLGCMEGLGWFLELHFAGAMLADLKEWIERIPAPVVIDHLGRIDPREGVDQAPFRALASLAQRDNIWIKLSGADRISSVGAPYDDIVPFVHRLTELAADRLIWGSDWPHTGYFDPAQVPDDGELVNALEHFIPIEVIRNRVLVDNPRRLLGCP